MNSLSWLIYLGGVVDSLQVVIGTVFFVGVIACFIGAIVCGVDGNRPGLVKVAKAFGALVAFGVVVSFVPSKSTVYMIAASQAGEKAVTTPEAKEMLGDLREVIAKQIKKLKDDK